MFSIDTFRTEFRLFLSEDADRYDRVGLSSGQRKLRMQFEFQANKGHGFWDVRLFALNKAVKMVLRDVLGENFEGVDDPHALRLDYEDVAVIQRSWADFPTSFVDQGDSREG